MNVPKIIHYCWFGGNSLSPESKKALDSWEKYAPGFEIKRCDESVFDPRSVSWTKSAYEAGKFAYVADYARFKMIYEFGGVYMDLGSELIRDITQLVETCSPFTAIEESSKTASPGLIISSQRANDVAGAVLAWYEGVNFYDNPEFLRSNTVNQVFTRELEKIGFKRENHFQKVGEWTALPSVAFNPVYGLGGYHIKRETFGIHHCSASWESKSLQEKKRVINKATPFIGRRPAQIAGRIIGEMKYGRVSNIFDVACERIRGTKR